MDNRVSYSSHLQAFKKIKSKLLKVTHNPKSFFLQNVSATYPENLNS